jgi:hypothetical protein
LSQPTVQSLNVINLPTAGPAGDAPCTLAAIKAAAKNADAINSLCMGHG